MRHEADFVITDKYIHTHTHTQNDYRIPIGTYSPRVNKYVVVPGRNRRLFRMLILEKNAQLIV